MERVPVRVPVAEGVKVTLMVQEEPAATVEQLLVWPKSLLFVPVMETLDIVSEPVPVLFTVTGWLELDVLTAWFVNIRDEVESETTGAVPVPESEIVCGLPVAESTIEIDPVRVPDAVGVKVTLIVQDPLFAATEVPQLLVSPKSPLGVMLVILSGAVPVFVSVTPWLELVVFTSCPVKVKLGLLRETIGAVPVPVSVIV